MWSNLNKEKCFFSVLFFLFSCLLFWVFVDLFLGRFKICLYAVTFLHAKGITFLRLLILFFFSTLLKCNNPAHQYHCIPDIDDGIVIKTVLPDCIMVMNKTISYLNELYGAPEQLLNEVINFELESITK